MLSRRLFLQTGGLASCLALAGSLVSPIALAPAPGENCLIVIILRGAMDGLDVFQPYGDPELRKLRRTISLGPEQGAHDLDGFFALHPELASLHPLWQKGELAFAPAVATPYRDKRSHFEGQDLLEAGTGMDLSLLHQRDGWLNRLLAEMPKATSETAYSVGIGQMRILAGKVAAKSWAPSIDLQLTPQAQRLLQLVYHDDPLFRTECQEAMEIAAEGAGPGRKEKGPDREVRALARFTAQQLKGETRIAAFSLPGWDSHARQAKSLVKALRSLSVAIVTLREELGPKWSRAAVLALTEFGRTVRENGAAGTDHGTGSAAILAGGTLRGGRALGAWPGLGESDLYGGRDLMPLEDVRRYAAWTLRSLFGIERNLLETTVFPGLEMGPDPGLIA